MNGHALLALQDLDTALTAIANKVARLPERQAVAVAETRLAACRADIVAQRTAVAEAAALIEQAEHDAATIAAKKARLEAQLKTVIAPREAEALMHEIEVLDGQRSVLDDGELAAMDAQATAEVRLSELGLEEAQAVLDVEAAQTALADAAGHLEQEAVVLREQRPAVEAALDATERAAYDRGRAQFAGVAIARLVGHRCDGCHLDLTPAEIDAIKAVAPGDLAECPQCSRFLVR